MEPARTIQVTPCAETTDEAHHTILSLAANPNRADRLASD
jgi:hypothetical protein